MPIEAQYRSGNSRLLFKITAEDQKGLFEQIAIVQEVFEADDRCGCCYGQNERNPHQGTNLRFRVRKAKDKKNMEHKYFELVCTDCYARLQFGQNLQGGTLFPKRRDEEGNFLKNRGWSKYEKQGGDD